MYFPILQYTYLTPNLLISIVLNAKTTSSDGVLTKLSEICQYFRLSVSYDKIFLYLLINYNPMRVLSHIKSVYTWL